MDKNKEKKLKKIGYIIPEVCGTCLHSDIKPGQDFGTCGLISYNHLKHSTDVRDLTIYRGGRCEGEGFYATDPAAEKRLGLWAQFIERRKFTRSNRHKQKVLY
jgi:hypothetical protein